MLSFDEQKKRVLEKMGKPDRSKKGTIDTEIKPLLDALNAHPDYYTTSSCSGRLMLLTRTNRKYDAQWLFTSHAPVDPKDIALPHVFPLDTLWLRQEAMILHLRARSLEAASHLLSLTLSTSFKHSGIMSIQDKIMMVLIGIDQLDVPIATQGKLLISPEYFEFLIHEANEKLRMNQKRIETFTELLKKKL